MLPLPVHGASSLPSTGCSCCLTSPLTCLSLQKQSLGLRRVCVSSFSKLVFHSYATRWNAGGGRGRHIYFSLNVLSFEKTKQISVESRTILGSFDGLPLPLIFKINILISPKPNLLKLATCMLNLLKVKRPNFTQVWVSTHLKLYHGQWYN